MSVYVDDARIAYGRMKMCHMVADTIEELHAIADAIGIKRTWFQPKSTPHYDICLSKRALAIQHGAIAVDRREMVTIIRRIRASHFA